jgi:hypothetical protein
MTLEHKIKIMNKAVIILGLLTLTSCSREPKTYPSGCQTEYISRKVNPDTDLYEQLLLIHCSDTVYYMLEDKLVYKFSVKKK